MRLGSYYVPQIGSAFMESRLGLRRDAGGMLDGGPHPAADDPLAYLISGTHFRVCGGLYHHIPRNRQSKNESL